MRTHAQEPLLVGWTHPGRARVLAWALGIGLGVCMRAGMGAVAAGTGAGDPPVDFNREVRPILSGKCFHCHGPDEAKRKGGRSDRGGLRLDTAAGQREDHGGGAAVVPGRPEASSLWRRVTTEDPDEVMPPSRSGARLTPAEAEVLRRWIASGAKFSNHWAYEPPRRPPLPAVHDPGWARNGLDRFIQARLEREGLTPQPEADRRVLARRLALDLTGLPPAPEEVRAFVEDGADGAYERHVERVLAKPGYGEHWARLWLDLARYADSAGYADDPPRTIWPYRDYVIRAFNENMPFDRFSIEQLAGDLLPDATEEQRKATAFHRNTMTNSEGGTNDEEFRNVAVVDRLNTTFAVWMGTSMACAQCHSHKYDPISQREYFQLFAFLNNTADADRPDEAPLLEFDSDELRDRRRRIEAEYRALEARFASAEPDHRSAAEAWAAVFPARVDWKSPRPSAARADSGAVLEVEADHAVRVRPKEKPAAKDSYTVELPFDTATVLNGLRIEALADPTLPGNGPGWAGDFRLRTVRARILPVPNQAGPRVRHVRVDLPGRGVLRLAEVEVFSAGENVALRARVTSSSAGPEGASATAWIDGQRSGSAVAGTVEEEKPWVELDLGAEVPVERLVLWPGSNPGTGLSGFRLIAQDAARKTLWERAGNTAPTGEMTFDLVGPRPVEFALASADHNAPALDESQVATDAPKSARYRRRGERGWGGSGAEGRDHALLLSTVGPVEVPRGATLAVTLAQDGGAGQVLGKFRISVTSDGRVRELVDTPPEVRRALVVAADDRSSEERAAVLAYFVRHVEPGLRDARERSARLQRERDEIRPLTVPVMRELTEPERRVTRVQLRGNYLVTAEEVSEGVPAVWPALPEGAPRNRLTLARWLVSPGNPLTARVLANRYWEQLFGVGIVRTSEEFGSQGDLPVHPELLDWLAVELVEGGWDLKRFLRLLVGSAAYRQSSRVVPEALEKDPDNRWVSRGPRFRLGAETVRDQALAAAGLLSTRLLGPSVRPPRPSLDLRAAFGGNLDWQASAGEDRYRRGLYTEWRRTSPYPSMATFDAPSREVCTLRRNRSNTPLQALVTLNDPVFVEAAQALARVMVSAGAGFEERLAHGYVRVLARPPTAREAGEMSRLLGDLRRGFQGAPGRAAALAGAEAVQERDPATLAEWAAWTGVANVLLNLDETLMKR